MKVLLGAIAVVLVVVLAVMAARPRAQMQPSPTLTPLIASPAPLLPSETPKTSSEPSASPTNVTVIKISGNSFRFNPSTIKVKKGDTVRVDLTAVDFPHSFNIDALGVEGPTVKPGNTGSVEFTASQTGTFQFYCAVDSHKDRGMVGTLTVQ